MRQLNRRQFLRRGDRSPWPRRGWPRPSRALARSSTTKPRRSHPMCRRPSTDAVPTVSEPVMARVTDATSGEVQMFFGTNATTIKDPEPRRPPASSRPVATPDRPTARVRSARALSPRLTKATHNKPITNRPANQMR